jgi:prevent-host-death family protein
MRQLSLAEAKARLSELVECVAAGEVVCITKRGKPVAKLMAAEPARKQIDLAALRDLTKTMPRQRQSAARLVRKMRDEARY